MADAPNHTQMYVCDTTSYFIPSLRADMVNGFDTLSHLGMKPVEVTSHPKVESSLKKVDNKRPLRKMDG